MPKNPAIHCDVVSCQHISEDGHYCSLDQINVGTHEPHPQVCECVDCKSFCKKCDCE